MKNLVNVKLENGLSVDINEESIGASRVIKSCENKVIKALEMLDESMRGDLTYSISTFVPDNKIAYFEVYPTKIYDQAEVLTMLVGGQNDYFCEGVEMYRVQLTLEDLIETDTTDIANMIKNDYIAYTNSIFYKVVEDSNITVHINDETDEVLIKSEDGVLKFNDDLQLVNAASRYVKRNKWV